MGLVLFKFLGALGHTRTQCNRHCFSLLPFPTGVPEERDQEWSSHHLGIERLHPYSPAQAYLLLGLLCQVPLSLHPYSVRLGLPWPLITTMRLTPATLLYFWTVFSMCYKSSLSQRLPRSQDPVLILAEYPQLAAAIISSQ